MKSPHGGFFKDDIVPEFSRIGYAVSFVELNAKEFGGPQHRERVFFVGYEGGASTCEHRSIERVVIKHPTPLPGYSLRKVIVPFR